MGSHTSKRRSFRSALERYSIAVVATAVALLFRKLLDPVLGVYSPYITLYPAIVLLAMYVGPDSSALCAISGVIGATYWFVPPRASFAIANKPSHAVGTLVFLMVAACIIAAGEVSRRSQTRLRRSKALFETFLDNSPGAEFLKDEAGRYIYVNRSTKTGFALDFIGKTDFDLFPATFASQWRANDLLVLEQNKALEFVETTPGPDGERTWVSVKFPVMDGESRRLLGGKSIDITEMRHAEKEIAALQLERAQQTAAELEAMVRLHEVGMRCLRDGNDLKGCLNFVLDAAVALTKASKGTMQLLDHSCGALRLAAQKGFDRPFLDFFAEVRDQPSTCGAAMRTGERVIIEDVLESKMFAGTRSLDILLDAGVRAVMSTPLISSSGKLLGMISTHYSAPHQPIERELRLTDLLARQAADYLERRQSEEALEASSARLRRFLEAAPTGLTRCSRDLRYLSANSAYARIAGLPVEEIVGRSIVEVMGPDGWETKRPYVERVLRGERVEYETVLPFAAGGVRNIHVVYTPEKEGQEIAGWVSSVTDITEFKRVEKQLQDIEKMAAAGQLAASLAHEINNPLSAVINVLYMLARRSDLDANATSLISIANNEIARVARIVKQSLSYYRVGMIAKEVDLAALAEESLQVFSDKFQRAGIAIRKKITPGTSIIGFADEIRQVVDNLLINAVEATPPGGHLTLCLRQSRSWRSAEPGARLTIADSGCGIPKSYLSRVFEPFFTTKAEKGTGLGLWVVKGIVEKHGGSIRVRSTETATQSGTVFSIFWTSAVKTFPNGKLTRSEYAA
jgi:PAS domain S-box-containing protein